MRKKENTSFNVADGLDFGNEVEETIVSKENAPSEPLSTQKPPKAPAKKVVEEAEIDPTRNYSPYYTPKPKKGSKGGTLGRGAVDAEERKVQFSLTCTPAQKQMFADAAKKDRRKLPDFICIAVEEYIKNHGLE